MLAVCAWDEVASLPHHIAAMLELAAEKTFVKKLLRFGK
jgi:hypothetical protein